MVVKYLERDGETVYRPPYAQSNTLLMGWQFESSLEAMQAILDHDLNGPANGAIRYRALSPNFIVTFANIRSIHSLDERDRNRGWTPEVDVCVWILAGATEPESNRIDRVSWYVPYIWVDNPYAVTAGRETLGYPKAIGWMSSPKDPATDDLFTLDSLVIPTFSKDSELVRKRIFSITRSRNQPRRSTARTASNLFASTLGPLLSEVRSGAPLSLFGNSAKQFFKGQMPMVFLKQFRDAQTSDGACYQGLIEANASIIELKRGGLLRGAWDLTLEQYDSLKIRDRLGIGPSTEAQQGFWLELTFTMDLGREIWRAQ